MRINRWLTGLVVAVGAGSAGTGVEASAVAAAAPAATIRVLSNRADLISGDDALVEVSLPAGVDPDGVSVRLNGALHTYQFANRANGRYMGLLSGLAPGRNTVAVRLSDGSRYTKEIVDHPIGGPVFSGPQVQPYTCLNAAAVDAQCNQPAVYTWQYKSTNPSSTGFQAYDPAHPATDVAMTTTDQGVTVPFIVRVETGYEDRDQYQIRTLFQPAKQWKPWAPQNQWNRKLVILHGSSCNVSYQNGDVADGEVVVPPAQTASSEVALGLGFAVAATALDNDGHNCNIVLQAESLMMLKEHLVETYGELRYTIGTGCSGGSLTQQQVANAYPGIYQGILPTCSFPDAWTTATQGLDYHLLRTYFENPAKWGTGVVWLPTQFAPVEGNLLPVDAVASDIGYFNAFVPTQACPGISAAQRYDAATNPGGVRCGVPDYMINVVGPRAPAVWTPNEIELAHGFAGVGIDNVGVQYGLSALQQGQILPAQFIDLNAKIGGLTIDITPTPDRIVADPAALLNVYRSGAVNEATHLDKVAIIDGRGPDPGAAHDSYRAFAVRARLDRAHGSHANQVIWEGPVAIVGDARYTVQGLAAIDRWLAAVEQDHGTKTLAQKIVADRPADIGDACFDGNGTKLADGLCSSTVVPVYGTPRTVAGDSIRTDTNKCRLKPLDRGDDYGPVAFSDPQWAQLQAIFPSGVCDFSQPGVSQRSTIAWQAYQDETHPVIYGGVPMPPVPEHSGGGWASGPFRVFSP